MRDKYRNEEYFKRLMEIEEKDISMFESAVKKSIYEKGENDRGTINGYNILINSYQNEINLLYSCGTKLDTIKIEYTKLLRLYGKMWDREYGYIDLIKVLSLAVLFEVDEVEISKLAQKLEIENFNDYLSNILIRNIIPMWNHVGIEFEFVGIYDYLKQVLASDEEQGCELLKEYLQKQWYDIHRDCAWYDSHKSAKRKYYGYWSFESGAIVKIMGWDDSSLKDVSYYPYDLVHYAK